MTKYSELCVFRLNMPMDEPDIRVSGIECVPVRRITKYPDGKVVHSQLSFALSTTGELVFADVLDDLLDLLYHDGVTEIQRVCTVIYDMPSDTRIRVLDIIPVQNHTIERISFY